MHESRKVWRSAFIERQRIIVLDYNGQPQDGSKAKEEEIATFATTFFRSNLSPAFQIFLMEH
jgi:hypothetical protein